MAMKNAESNEKIMAALHSHIDEQRNASKTTVENIITSETDVYNSQAINPKKIVSEQQTSMADSHSNQFR